MCQCCCGAIPLDRPVSLFFDKCRAAVATDAPQEVQRVLLDALGERDVGALMTLRFDEMVRLLPQVRDQEDHIWPQMQDVDVGHIGEVVDVAWACRGSAGGWVSTFGGNRIEVCTCAR